MAPLSMTLDDPHRNMPIFFIFFIFFYRATRYILCDGPMLVCPSVWLGAEGPRDA